MLNAGSNICIKCDIFIEFHYSKEFFLLYCEGSRQPNILADSLILSRGFPLDNLENVLVFPLVTVVSETK